MKDLDIRRLKLYYLQILVLFSQMSLMQRNIFFHFHHLRYLQV
eukprot:UN07362